MRWLRNNNRFSSSCRCSKLRNSKLRKLRKQHSSSKQQMAVTPALPTAARRRAACRSLLEWGLRKREIIARTVLRRLGKFISR